MVDFAAIRAAAIALPGAAEHPHRGSLYFQVGTKGFVVHWAPENRWIFKLPHAHQDLLFAARPETFRPYRAGAMLWSYVEIGRLDLAEAQELVTEAWAMVAPKKVSRPFLEAHAPALLRLF